MRFVGMCVPVAHLGRWRFQLWLISWPWDRKFEMFLFDWSSTYVFVCLNSLKFSLCNSSCVSNAVVHQKSSSATLVEVLCFGWQPSNQIVCKHPGLNSSGRRLEYAISSLELQAHLFNPPSFCVFLRTRLSRLWSMTSSRSPTPSGRHGMTVIIDVTFVPHTWTSWSRKPYRWC